jgi:ribonucleoside-diphosphate reductase beta chain
MYNLKKSNINTVFNKNSVDFTKQPMFFGESQNIQRFDTYKYANFDKLTQKQLGFFWRPEEVSLQKDRADYLTFRPEQKRIFTSNLKYQILLDSVQGRGPALAFLPFCSLPELESCIITWDFFETIHSRSYTHIIKNVYANPSEVFDSILDDKEILARANSVTRMYDDFLNYADQYKAGAGDLNTLKEKMYLAMVTVNALEGLRFYVSFACSFAFGELKKMEGSAKIISFIARDETQHLAISQNIIKHWNNGDDPGMLDIVKKHEVSVKDIYKQVVNEEKKWAEYLFEEGSIIGLNEKLLAEYIEYLANRRLKSIGIEPIFDRPLTQNPLPWTTHWFESKDVQVAPQETEVESYVIGGIKQDVDMKSFSNFEL